MHVVQTKSKASAENEKLKDVDKKGSAGASPETPPAKNQNLETVATVPAEGDEGKVGSCGREVEEGVSQSSSVDRSTSGQSEERSASAQSEDRSTSGQSDGRSASAQSDGRSASALSDGRSASEETDEHRTVQQDMVVSGEDVKKDDDASSLVPKSSTEAADPQVQ